MLYIQYKGVDTEIYTEKYTEPSIKPNRNSFFQHEILNTMLNISILFILQNIDILQVLKALSFFFIYELLIFLNYHLKKMYLNKWSPIMKIIDNSGEKIRFKAVCGFNPLESFDIKISYIEYKTKLRKIVSTNKRKILHNFKKGHDYNVRLNNDANTINVTLVCPEIYTTDRLMFDV
jgi:hypothetical protein